jgi:hypothetical protein
MSLIKNVLKKRDVLLALIFNFALQYAIRNVQINQDVLKLNGTHNLVVYADDINTLSGMLRTMKRNAEALVVAIKETGLQVNADKTKYLLMSRDQNARRIHITTTDMIPLNVCGRFQIFGNHFNKSKFYSVRK